jgi:hypothetical protein
MSLINFLIEHWAVIVAVIVFVVSGVVSVRKFLLQPSEKQIEQIMQWLLDAVTAAEKALGSGTGKLKLSRVYGWFVGAFPWLARIIPIEMFNDLVDESLDSMREMIQTNPDVAEVVGVEMGE